MGERNEDALTLLLPEAPPPLVQRARRVTTFLRLLAHDAQPESAQAVAISLERARGELERHQRARRRAIVLDLLRHHLDAALEAGAFAWWGEPAAPPGELWSALHEPRGDADDARGLPHVPEPGEPALAVADRLLAAAAEQGLSEGRRELWRLRRVRAGSGPAEAEPGLRRLAERAEPGSPFERECTAAVAEALLDRGAVPRARAWLEERTPRGAASAGAVAARLGWLGVWARLLHGDEAGARGAAATLEPWPGRLPCALVELRERRPEWTALLCGRPFDGGRAVAARDEAPRARTELGASFLGVFRLSSCGEAELLRADVAPGLRGRLEAWLGEREGCVSRPGEPEHELVATGRVVVAHRGGDDGPRGALGGEATRALALAPVVAGDGEVCGWLRIECEHHLLPPSRALATWAAALCTEVGGGAPRGALPADALALDLEAPAAAAADPCCAVFEELVAELGTKTRERRWFGVELEGDALRLCAHGGEALEPRPGCAGGGRLLSRALATRGPVAFDAPDPALSLHAESAAGVAVPLATRRRVGGLLVVESTRRRDFRAADLERFAAAAGRHAHPLGIAQFRRWHDARFGHDVHFAAGPQAFAGRLEDFLVAGRSRAAVLVSGPPGCGKRVVARWLHFESERRAGPLAVHGCGASEPGNEERELLEALEEGRAGSVLLLHVDRLPAPLQARLARRLDEAEEGAPRLVATRAVPEPCEPRASGLVPALARRLERLELFVPALAERRAEIPDLVRLLARRFAREEGLRAPRWSDPALALLWRQAWPGNVRELENLVFKLVLLHAGEEIEPQAVLSLARRFRLELRRRIPSRHPDERDLRAALETTRTGRDTWNKTRAALYLGWDPDTLVARLRDAGLLDDESP